MTYDAASSSEANAVPHLGFDACCWSVEYAPGAAVPREAPRSAGEPTAGAGERPGRGDPSLNEDAAAPSEGDPEALALALWNEGRKAEAIAVLEQQIARVKAPHEAGSSPLQGELVETDGRALALIAPSAMAILQSAGSDRIASGHHAHAAIVPAARPASRREPGEIIHFAPEPRPGRFGGVHWVDMRTDEPPRFARRAWVAALCLAMIPALAAGAMLWKGADRAEIESAQPADGPSVAVREAPARPVAASRPDASPASTMDDDVPDPAPAAVEPADAADAGPAPAVAEDRTLGDAPQMAEPASPPPVAEPTSPPEEVAAETPEPRVPTPRPTMPTLFEAPGDADMLAMRDSSPAREYSDLPRALAERRAAAERYVAERRAVAERAAREERGGLLRQARGF